MYMIKNFYQGVVSSGESFANFFLLLIRLFWGYSFFISGWKKIENIDSAVTFFSSLEIPFPEFFAPLVGWVECLGGACLFFGFGSRLVSIPLAIVMITALFTSHFEVTKKLFENPQEVMNLAPFNYLLTCLIVFAFGPGKFSFDCLLEKLFTKGK
jgi:putative oxidoreductase